MKSAWEIECYKSSSGSGVTKGPADPNRCLNVGQFGKLNRGTSKAAHFALETHFFRDFTGISSKMFNFRERQQKGRGRQEGAVFQQGAPTGNVTPLSSGLIGLVAHLVNLAGIAKGSFTYYVISRGGGGFPNAYG